MNRRNAIIALIGLLALFNVGGYWFLKDRDTTKTVIPTLAVVAEAEQPSVQVLEVLPQLQQSSDNPATTAPEEAQIDVPTTHIEPSSENPVLDSIATPIPDTNHQITIVFNPAADAVARTTYLEQIGGRVAQEIPALNAVVVDMSGNPDGLASLPLSPAVANAEPDYLVTALDAPDDTLYPQQWNLAMIGVPQLWDNLPANPATIMVAVIDSGICYSHPDLSGRILSNGYDYVEKDSHAQDVYGHGCAVSGIIAANANNAIGLAGIAPHVQLMPLRVLNENGVGQYSNVAAAITYATDHGAQVINLSLGGSNASTILQNAVAYAAAHGVTVVAAAGNTGQEGVYYPAAYASVIAVGAVDANGQRSSFSTYGVQLDTLAPGRNIHSTQMNGSYNTFTGTSFAAPHIAGLVALSKATGMELVLNPAAVAYLAGEPQQPVTTPVTAIPTAAPDESVTPPAPITATPEATPTKPPPSRPGTGSNPDFPPPPNAKPVIPRLPMVAPNNDPLFMASDLALSLDDIEQNNAARMRTATINMGALAQATTAFYTTQALASQTVVFNLFPDVTLAVDYELMQPRMTASAGYNWVGRVQGMPESDVALVIGDNMLHGLIKMRGVHYRISHIANGQHTIVEILPDSSGQFPADGILPSPDLIPASATASGDVSAQSIIDDGTQIDVMVVYSTASKTAAGSDANMIAEIEAEIVSSNNSFIFGGVNTSFRLVLAREIPGYTDLASNDFEDDLYNLADFGDGFMEDIHLWREDVNADLVAYIRRNVQVTSTPQGTFFTCGIGFVMDDESWEFNDVIGMSVTARQCFGDYTFAHELGHNMGSQHDEYNSYNGGVLQSGAFPYSYGYQDFNRFHTIMAYNNCGSGCQGINRWSSPTQFYNGRPLGIQNVPGYVDTNNVQSINNTRDTVSQYRLGIPEPPSDLAWTDQTATSVTIEWVDNSNNEENFRVWKWDGVTWQNQYAILAANDTDFTDVGQSCGTPYFYTVSSYRTDDAQALADDFLLAQTLSCSVVHDSYFQPIDIGTTPYTQTVDVTDTSYSPTDPEISCEFGIVPRYDRSVWYSYTPTVQQRVNISTAGSNYDTVVAVFNNTFTPIGCNDEALAPQSELSVILNAGTTYYILVVEYDVATALSPSLTLNISSDEYYPTNSAQLVDAVLLANANDLSQEIYLASGATFTLNAPYAGDNGLPIVTADELDIYGQGAAINRNVAAANFRHFTVASSATLSLDNLTLRNGHAVGAGLGGSIWNSGELHITGSTFDNNSVSGTSGFGGAIYNDGTLVDVASTTFIQNAATRGGAIYYSSGAAHTITNSKLFYNTATDTGSAIYATDTMTVSNACIQNNSDTAIVNSSGNAVNAQTNWWGAAEGAQVVGGNQFGDSVSANITVTNHLTLPPAGCFYNNDDVRFAFIPDVMPFDYSTRTNLGNSPFDTAIADPSASCAVSQKNVWYQVTPTYSGTFNVDTFGSTFDTVLSMFTGSPGSLSQVVCNDNSGGAQSKVTFAVTGGTTYYIMIGGKNGASGTIEVSMYFTPPANDNNSNATVVTLPLPYSDTKDTRGATTQINDPLPTCGTGHARNIWYKFTPSVDARYEFNTFGSTFDTVLALYTGTYPALTEIACNDDDTVNATVNSRIEIDLLAGQTYTIQIAGDQGANGLVTFNVGSFQFIQCADVVGIPVSECEALVSLYNSTGGIGWVNDNLWLYDKRPCTWYGVICTDGHVTGLNLPANQLRGLIPANILNLTELDTLAIDANGLYTDNPTVDAFLESIQAGWKLTQTIPVTNLVATTVDHATINLTWTPIAYTGGGGFYEIQYRRKDVPTFTVHGVTADKTVANYTLNNLPVSSQQYVIRVLSYTALNAVYSIPAETLGQTSAVQPTATFTPTETPIPTATPEPSAKTVGLYANGEWWFKDVNESGDADLRFRFGPADTGWQPLSGDWNGDGTDGIGVFKNGVFLLRDSTDAGVVDYQVGFGITDAGWQAVVGDWNGDGIDSVGMFKNGQVLLTNDLVRPATAHYHFNFDPFGNGRGVLIAGDWSNASRDSIGLYYNGQFVLKVAPTLQASVLRFNFGPNESGWMPIAGDWNADGLDTIGLYRDGNWRLRNDNTTGAPDEGFVFRAVGVPIANYHGSFGALVAMSDSLQIIEPIVLPSATASATATIEMVVDNTPTATTTPLAEVTEDVFIVPTASYTPIFTPSATATYTPSPTSEATEEANP